jgi:hypothetical protein
MSNRRSFESYSNKNSGTHIATNQAAGFAEPTHPLRGALVLQVPPPRDSRFFLF